MVKSFLKETFTYLIHTTFPFSWWWQLNLLMMGMITSIYVVVRSVLLLLLMALMLFLLDPLLFPANYWWMDSRVQKFWAFAWYWLKSKMKYAFISEENLLLDTQSVDSSLCKYPYSSSHFQKLKCELVTS